MALQQPDCPGFQAPQLSSLHFLFVVHDPLFHVSRHPKYIVLPQDHPVSLTLPPHSSSLFLLPSSLVCMWRVTTSSHQPTPSLPPGSLHQSVRSEIMCCRAQHQSVRSEVMCCGAQHQSVRSEVMCCGAQHQSVRSEVMCCGVQHLKPQFTTTAF